MSQNSSKDRESSPVTRLGDFVAVLRLMRPLNTGGSVDEIDNRRHMLADLCKFIGVKLEALPPESLEFPVARIEPPAPRPASASNDQAVPEKKLAPRLQQTLDHLLTGDSEKQVALKLNLSQHTVHVYVKSLYRKFNVSSRAELMSRYLKK